MESFTGKLHSYLTSRFSETKTTGDSTSPVSKRERKQMAKIKTFADVQKDLWETDPYQKFVLDSLGKVMAYQDRLGWTRDQLADKAGLPYDTVEAIFAGDVIPGITTMNMLMNAVGFEWTLEPEEDEE